MRSQASNQSDEPSATGTKSRKLPASRLPFERIPDGYDLHDLETTCSIDLSLIPHVSGKNMQDDLYIEDDNEAMAFSGSKVEVCTPLWDERLSFLMQRKFKKNDQSLLSTWRTDLSTIISTHLRDIDAS